MTEQEKFVLDILQRERGITRLKAQHYNIGNINGVISRLRQKGWDIGTMTRTDAKGQYYNEWTFIGWVGMDMRPSAIAERGIKAQVAEGKRAAEKRNAGIRGPFMVVGGTEMSHDLAGAVAALTPRSIN
jgi:hypothetical protein